jgi:hypothetical protein
MVHKIHICLLLCFYSAASLAADKIDDNIIVPGERVGFITKDTTEDDLKKLLPPNSIKRVVQNNEEGGFGCVTKVFVDTPKELVIWWNYNEYADTLEGWQKCEDAIILGKPYLVEINQGTYWLIKSDVGVGVNLEQLEKINAAPIDVDVSESCFAGGINSWNNGYLSKEFESGSGVYFSFRMDYDSDAVQPYRKMASVKSSDLPPAIKQRVAVGRVTVLFRIDEE